MARSSEPPGTPGRMALLWPVIVVPILAAVGTAVWFKVSTPFGCGDRLLTPDSLLASSHRIGLLVALIAVATWARCRARRVRRSWTECRPGNGARDLRPSARARRVHPLRPDRRKGLLHLTALSARIERSASRTGCKRSCELRLVRRWPIRATCVAEVPLNGRAPQLCHSRGRIPGGSERVPSG